MGEKTESTLTTIFYIVLFTILVTLVLQNIVNPWTLILLSGFLIASFTFRNAMVYGNLGHRNLGKIQIFIDVALIFFINHFDKGGSSQIYYYILIGDACIAYTFLFGGFVTLACFLSFVLQRFLWAGLPPSGIVSGIALNFLAFFSIYAIMFIVKYEIRQREKLSDIMFELKVKTKQLENTYVKLKETSKELEEVTALRERNRIARDIHDTVGHTLTTVLLEMEAGERILKVNQELALEKYALAKGQVRKGLNDIRESVSTLQSGREIHDLATSLKLLINETVKHGDINIRYDIPELPRLGTPLEKTLYRALQEGLTNSIKHGKSTAFVFIMKYDKNNIKFLLQDNGKGSDKVVYGFGLTGMNERVRELGGVLTVDSKPGEGFNINISIPVEKEIANGSNKSVDC
jgi:signal transduction histidine kinase